MLTLKGRMRQRIALYWSISGYLFQPPVKESSWIWAFSNLSATTIYIYISMFISVYIKQPVPFFSRSPSQSGILWKEVRVFPCSWQSSIGIPVFNKPGESCTFVTKINTSPTQGCLPAHSFSCEMSCFRLSSLKIYSLQVHSHMKNSLHVHKCKHWGSIVELVMQTGTAVVLAE